MTLAGKKSPSLRVHSWSDTPHSPLNFRCVIARDFDPAACEMAALIETPCWLVPIPASDGSTRANTILAAHIARHRPGAQIAKAIRRTRPIESQCSRHRRNLTATPPEEHHLKAALSSLCHRQIYFVDNVATSGNTMRAANAALQHGAGLVFADAGGHTTDHPEPALL